MAIYLFLLFTVVPLVELAGLVWLGGQTAWWVPILVILVDAVAGTVLLRWQGLRTLQRIQEDLAAGRMPGAALVDGALILVAAVLLITPGILTDVVAFALLVPPLRQLVKHGVQALLRRHVEVKTAQFRAGFQTGGAGGDPANRDQIVDAHVINTRVQDAH